MTWNRLSALGTSPQNAAKLMKCSLGTALARLSWAAAQNERSQQQRKSGQWAHLTETAAGEVGLDLRTVKVAQSNRFAPSSGYAEFAAQLLTLPVETYIAVPYPHFVRMQEQRNAQAV